MSVTLCTDYADVFNLVKRFQQLQEERVHIYRLFNEGHKIYLGSAPNYDFIRFRQLVFEVTQEFKRISDGIISIEKKLRLDCGKIAIANFISQVQEDEKRKLELTATLQLTKQGLVDHPDELEREIVVLQLKQRLNHVAGRINESLEDLRYELEDI